MSTPQPNDGGPAFPQAFGNEHDEYLPGMSMRDWFAGMALSGLAQWRAMKEIDQQQEIAADAYDLADAMLAERNKEKA